MNVDPSFIVWTVSVAGRAARGVLGAVVVRWRDSELGDWAVGWPGGGCLNAGPHGPDCRRAVLGQWRPGYPHVVIVLHYRCRTAQRELYASAAASREHRSGPDRPRGGRHRRR
ncbi:MAG TPA: hypothetical protein VH478_09535 [Trebonia sp.]|nr:hypothetical protein [Trebonia sp.]